VRGIGQDEPRLTGFTRTSTGAATTIPTAVAIPKIRSVTRGLTSSSAKATPITAMDTPLRPAVGIYELGLAHPGAALDDDGASGAGAHLSKPLLDDSQLVLAAPKGQGLSCHIRSRTKSVSVLATSSKGDLLCSALERTTAPSVAAMVTVAMVCAASSAMPPTTKSSAS